MKVILETDRLLLREYVEEDAEAFFKLNSDPEVLRFVPDKALLNVEQARQILIDHPIADYRKHGFGRGACILKSTGENIGFAGLEISRRTRRGRRRIPPHAGLLGSGIGNGSCACLGPLRIRRARSQTNYRPGYAREHRFGARLEKTGLRFIETVTFWGHQFSKYVITR